VKNGNGMVKDTRVILEDFLRRQDISKERRRAVRAFIKHGTFSQAASSIGKDPDTVVKHVVHSLVESVFGRLSEL
jgi:hypothetical protein